MIVLLLSDILLFRPPHLYSASHPHWKKASLFLQILFTPLLTLSHAESGQLREGWSLLTAHYLTSQIVHKSCSVHLEGRHHSNKMRLLESVMAWMTFLKCASSVSMTAEILLYIIHPLMPCYRLFLAALRTVISPLNRMLFFRSSATLCVILQISWVF